tara:strand:+ start:1039 stop:1293 length:255 start_codon:yes stop_codon:yes gene_type:complete
MKITNLIFQLFISIALIATFLYWRISFNSAFEADKTCHASLVRYLVESENYGCDHDTETHQWILYRNLDDSKFEIIERFRYKFL